jgi:hypothetical protein
MKNRVIAITTCRTPQILEALSSGKNLMGDNNTAKKAE